METMEEVFKGEAEMHSLKGEGKLEESARIGREILQGFRHLSLIEREAYKVCFNEMTKEEFYEHVIKVAIKVVNEFRS